jgi:hypothetical protein
MAPLPAGTVENARANRELENFDEPRDLTSITLEIEERLIFQEIARIEIGRPPIGGRRGCPLAGRGGGRR